MDSQNWNKLTERQQLIYDLYFNQRITQKDISNRLGISQQAVSNHIKNIKKKVEIPDLFSIGCIKRGIVNINSSVTKNTKTLKKAWRVEAVQFMIKPYYFYPRYAKMRDEIGNYSISHKRWLIFLYRDVVRIQLKKGFFFRDPDKLLAVEQMEDDFNRFLYFAANKYGFEYSKEGKINIKLTNWELEREDSEFAQGYEAKTGENKLNIRDINGKVCFFIDQSKSSEHGYKGKDSLSNSEVLEPYIQDLLFNQPLSNSQLTMRLNDVVTALEKIKEILVEGRS